MTEERGAERDAGGFALGEGAALEVVADGEEQGILGIGGVEGEVLELGHAGLVGGHARRDGLPLAIDGVYSEHVPHEHELVHAVRRDGLPAVFEEGLATMFGDLGWTAEPSPRENLTSMLEASEIFGLADYARASHFVAFLVEQNGIEPFVTLAKLGDREDAYSKVRRDFETAFGISLDQALTDYADFPECNSAAWMDRRIACDVPGFPLAPGVDMEVGISLDLTRASSEVLGPFSGYMFTDTTLDVTPELPGLPVWLFLVGDLAPDTSALLVSCDTSCADSTVKWLDDVLPGEYLDLPPGRYLLRVFRPADDPGMLGITMRQ